MRAERRLVKGGGVVRGGFVGDGVEGWIGILGIRGGGLRAEEVCVCDDGWESIQWDGEMLDVVPAGLQSNGISILLASRSVRVQYWYRVQYSCWTLNDGVSAQGKRGGGGACVVHIMDIGRKSLMRKGVDS